MLIETEVGVAGTHQGFVEFKLWLLGTSTRQARSWEAIKSCHYLWELPSKFPGKRLSYRYPNYLKLQEGLKLYPWLLKD